MLVLTDRTANFVETHSAAGTLIFDGNGNFTVTGQQLVGTTPPAALSRLRDLHREPRRLHHSVQSRSRRLHHERASRSGRFGRILHRSRRHHLRLLVAIPAASQSLTNQTFTGVYWISSLEFPNGAAANIRDTNFKLTASGTGGFRRNNGHGPGSESRQHASHARPSAR